MTQSLRALLASRDVRVHAVLTGPVDTDMTRTIDIPKASPESVARAIFDAVEKEEEDIFPDPMSQFVAEELAQQPGQDARTPAGGARASARHGIINSDLIGRWRQR
jgi:short-subunit dehydrogenase